MAPRCRPWEFHVMCELAAGETVCVVGSAPHLGSWRLDCAVELQTTESTKTSSNVSRNGTRNGTGNETENGTGNGAGNGMDTGADDATETVGSVCRGTVTLPVDSDVFYRYCVCLVLSVDGQRRLVIRRWETDLAPRRLAANVLANEGRCPQLEQFGYITPMRHVDRGWLSVESVVQLKFYNNPVELWKTRNTRYCIKVTPMNLENRMLAAESPVSGDESSELDSQTLSGDFTWPIIELSVMQDGETSFGRQEQFGREYRQHDFFTFQCQMIRPDSIAYMVDLYSAAAGDDTPQHLGFCHILPKSLAQTSGELTLPVTGPRHQPVGQLTVEYLLVRPMTEVRCAMDRSFSRYWHDTWRGLDVGHRGAGNSFTHKPEVCANVRENTIASLKRAVEHGADFVEFDIQLSKDLTPLIYHDFHVNIALRRKDAVSGHHLLTVPLKDLEHGQLQQLQVYHLEEGTMGSEHLQDDSHEENQPFPSLALALDSLDPHVGFNIEIKWTMQLQDGSFELHHPFELNSYIDNILKVVLNRSGARKIIFSCFHPDICTMLRLKQNRYPVLFLTQGETDQWPPYLDTRCRSLQMALLFARSAQILGVNVFSGVLLEQPEFVQRAQAQGLVVFCWGDENASVDTIRYLKALGCDAVIYDRMDTYCTKDTKESVFLLEARQAEQMKLGGAEALSDGSDVGSEVATEACAAASLLVPCPPAAGARAGACGVEEEKGSL